jgi:hypothetical protein
MVQLSNRQRAAARAALGLPNPQRRSYRNRYTASRAGETHEVWRGMVELGLAAESAPIGDKFAMFVLTPAGARAALDPDETLDPEDFPDG